MDRNGHYRFQVSSLGIHYIAVFGTRKYFDLSSRIHRTCLSSTPYVESLRALARLHHFYMLNAKVGEFLGRDLV